MGGAYAHSPLMDLGISFLCSSDTLVIGDGARNLAALQSDPVKERGHLQILLGHVGIFFFVENEFLLHQCALEAAQPYGDFLNYPLSHDAVWEKSYRRKFGVDFDYHPRGRILFNQAAQIYLIYFDGCIEKEIEELTKGFGSARFQIARDEHYQCHRCNLEYTLVER